MKKVNEDLLAMIKLIANQMGYDLVAAKSDKSLITWTLLNETEQAQLEAKSVEELNKELLGVQSKIDETMRELNTKKNELQVFLNKNLQSNKAVNVIAGGYGYTLPSNLIEVESTILPKLNQQDNLIRDLIFKKSMEELSEAFGKKIEFAQRSSLGKFVIKL